MTFDLSVYPQCARRLHFQRVNLAEAGMNAYWAAAIVAGDFRDKDLTEFGGFDFDDRSAENGYRQLARLEQFMAARRPERAPAANDAYAGALQRVRAMIGSYGIKTSIVKRPDDFWTVAAILWPGHITRPAAPRLSDLVRQIEAIAKNQRGAIARANAKRVPGHLVSDNARIAA